VGYLVRWGSGSCPLWFIVLARLNGKFSIGACGWSGTVYDRHLSVRPRSAPADLMDRPGRAFAAWENMDFDDRIQNDPQKFVMLNPSLADIITDDTGDVTLGWWVSLA